METATNSATSSDGDMKTLYSSTVEKYRHDFDLPLYTHSEVRDLLAVPANHYPSSLGDSGVDQLLQEDDNQMQIMCCGLIKSFVQSDTNSVLIKTYDPSSETCLFVEVPSERLTQDTSAYVGSIPSHQHQDILEFNEFGIGDILLVSGTLNLPSGQIVPGPESEHLTFFRTFQESYQTDDDLKTFSEPNEHLENTLGEHLGYYMKLLFGFLEDFLSDLLLTATWKGELVGGAHRKVLCHPMGIIMAAKYKQGQNEEQVAENSENLTQGSSFSVYLRDPTGLPFDTTMLWQSTTLPDFPLDVDHQPDNSNLMTQQKLFNLNPWDRYRVNPSYYVGSEWTRNRLIINVRPPGRNFSLCWSQPGNDQHVMVAFNCEASRHPESNAIQLDLRPESGGSIKMADQRSILCEKIRALETTLSPGTGTGTIASIADNTPQILAQLLEEN